MGCKERVTFAMANMWLQKRAFGVLVWVSESLQQALCEVN